MTDISIRAENLSKLYRIGQRAPYQPLRDTLTDAMYAPFRSLATVFSGLRSAVGRRRSSVHGRLSHDLAAGALLQLDPRR